jgi:hypothetical protein
VKPRTFPATIYKTRVADGAHITYRMSIMTDQYGGDPWA